MKKELFDDFESVPEKKLGSIFSGDPTESTSLVVGQVYTCASTPKYVESDNIPKWVGVGLFTDTDVVFVSPKSICGVKRLGAKLVRYNEQALQKDLIDSLRKGLVVKFLGYAENQEVDRYVNGKVDGVEKRRLPIFAAKVATPVAAPVAAPVADPF